LEHQRVALRKKPLTAKRRLAKNGGIAITSTNPGFQRQGKSLVNETPKIAAVVLADRVGAQDAERFAARLPSNHEWRQIIEEWLESDASYLIAVDLPDRVLVGTPECSVQRASWPAASG
jgi:hypothetical protein